ncbi:MAG: 50S ribosomal protein L2 [Candidatus Hodarchaeota archaeon]
MGKRILAQRRGRGSPSFRASSHGRKASAKYIFFGEQETKKPITGEILKFIHDPGRGTPLALIRYENGEKTLIPAIEGTYEGQKIEQGTNAPLNIGNTLPLHMIPEGTPVCNIEIKQGDGGKIVRASGTTATVQTHTPTLTIIQLPSGALKEVSKNARATIGVIAAGGRTEKPFIKAGRKHAWYKSKGAKIYPKVRGVAMSPVSHPHGGGAHQHIGHPSTVSRHSPPGRKVGLIAARRAGRKKRK